MKLIVLYVLCSADLSIISALHFSPFSHYLLKKFGYHFVDSLTKDLNEFYGDEHVRKEYEVKGRFGLEGNKKKLIEMFARKFFYEQQPHIKKFWTYHLEL